MNKTKKIFGCERCIYGTGPHRVDCPQFKDPILAHMEANPEGYARWRAGIAEAMFGGPGLTIISRKTKG